MDGFGGIAGYFLWVVIAAPLAVLVKKLIDSGYIKNDDYALGVSNKLAKSAEREWEVNNGTPNMGVRAF